MANRLVVFGLSISSSWGNGHATTYRGLLGALAVRGWDITFFERDVEWYRLHRDLPDPTCCDLRLYEDWTTVRADAATAVRAADAVLVGSYAGDAQTIIDWLTIQGRPTYFYDIDTPITLTALRNFGEAEYLRADQIPFFDAYFSFTGGPALQEIENVWHCRQAVALYCGVDSDVYRPSPMDPRYACALGYMGTYAPDRQPKLEALLIEAARRLPSDRFLIAGPLYPPTEHPANLIYIDHVNPGDHAAFYCSNRATLNLTREAMVRYGWSPSVRLFEAAACGACIISDVWSGLDELLEPDQEILFASTIQDVLAHIQSLTPERRYAIGAAARRRILTNHTYEQRARLFESTCVSAVKAY